MYRKPSRQTLFRLLYRAAPLILVLLVGAVLLNARFRSPQETHAAGVASPTCYTEAPVIEFNDASVGPGAVPGDAYLKVYVYDHGEMLADVHAAWGSGTWTTEAGHVQVASGTWTAYRGLGAFTADSPLYVPSGPSAHTGAGNVTFEGDVTYDGPDPIERTIHYPMITCHMHIYAQGFVQNG